jgi:molybdate transport system substrate-binding protein
MTTISGISSMATQALLGELAQAWRARSGCAVRFESVGGVVAVRRVEAGEPFDLVVLAQDAIDALAAQGHLRAGSTVALVRSGVAVAVPAGAPRPDLSTEDAVRAAVLAARRVGVSTGPSGVQLLRLFERWGIAGTLQPRLVQAPPGVPVGALLARGEVTLGFQQLSELIHVEGIDVVGPLPPSIQIETVFAAAVGARSALVEDAARCIGFMASPEADDAKRRQGMAPA